MSKKIATHELICQTAEHFVAHGRSVTTLEIRKITGGSFGTVGSALELWREARATHQICPMAPEDVEAFAILARSTYAKGASSARAALEVQLEERDKKLGEIDAEKRELDQEKEELESKLSKKCDECDQLTLRLRAAEIELTEMRGRYFECRTQGESVNSDLAQRGQALVDSQRELGELRGAYALLEKQLDTTMSRASSRESNGAFFASLKHRMSPKRVKGESEALPGLDDDIPF